METRKERTARIREMSIEGFEKLVRDYYDEMRIFSCRR